MESPAPIIAEADPEACAAASRGGCLVGLSGGRDSVALLLMLLELGCPRLAAFHLNHGIRGAEADADEQFCRELCARLGIRLCCRHADIPALAKEKGESMETAARNARRRIMAELAHEQGLPAIALAHHADDQAETVIFRMGRGSAGARGMKAVEQGPGNTLLLRPLLGVRRDAITQWLLARGESWRDDSTNSVADVARNRIRHEVIPALRQAMGRDVVPILCRSARLQQETQEALEAAVRALPILDPQGRLYLPFVLRQPPVLQKVIIHHYLQSRGVPQISESMVQSIAGLLPPDAATARLCLPGGYMAIRRQKRLIIDAASSKQNS